MGLKEYKYQIDDEVKVNLNAKGGMPSFVGRVGKVIEIVEKGSYDYEVAFDKHTTGKFKEGELALYIGGDFKEGKFTEIALELGRFTDDKNKQYGSSVDATYEMIKVLMDRYTYDEENYIMPKSLLRHLLLQVRMMDKQNRIFNNPSGKDEKESPYRDLCGYSLIGVDMVEQQNDKSS